MKKDTFLYQRVNSSGHNMTTDNGVDYSSQKASLVNKEKEESLMQHDDSLADLLVCNEITLMPAESFSYQTSLDTSSSDKENKPNWKLDRFNICFLTFLYVLQGIPLGISAVMPMVLQNKNVSYKEQAIFSLAFWPFSLKLIWAPIVDVLYSKRIGRRKTWLIPTQYLIGIVMLAISGSITYLMDNAQVWGNLVVITMVFSLLNFLAATQDIAVDGWALTMLCKRNIGYASTCNSMGQTAGFFIGNVIFLALESADFCNNWLRSVPKPHGILSLSSFLNYNGIVFIISTTLVLLCIKEKAPIHQSFRRKSSRYDLKSRFKTIFHAYTVLFQILKLKSIQSLVVILLTMKIAFSTADNVTSLKLIEAGVSKEKLALILIPIVPFQIIFPLLLNMFANKSRPFITCYHAIPYRLFMGIVFSTVVYWTPFVKIPPTDPNSPPLFPYYYYILLIIIYILHQIAVFSMFVSMMAFFAQISDPSIGGTYMTLLNTLANLGGNWPSTLALYFVESFQINRCSVMHYLCNTPKAREGCIKDGGRCEEWIDGYYVETILCFLFGVFWLIWKRKKVLYLQNLNISAWKSQFLSHS